MQDYYSRKVFMMARYLVIGIVLFAALIVLQGCDCNCDDDMDDCKKKNGEPEEINTYSSDGYNSTDFWYWSKGVQYGFTWGSNVDGCCDKSTYTFDPIGKDASEDEKAAAKKAKVLYSNSITPRAILEP